MRPVASLLVILTHAMQMFAPAGSVFYGAILLESQASRHIFFFVSALVLMYQARGRGRGRVWPFWGRRFTTVVVPFILWTVVYALLAFTGLRGDTIPSMTGPPLHMLQTVGIQLITGTGHLYFVIVLVQFYLLFPLLAWVLDRAARWHLAIVGVGLAAQLARHHRPALPAHELADLAGHRRHPGDHLLWVLPGGRGGDRSAPAGRPVLGVAAPVGRGRCRARGDGRRRGLLRAHRARRGEPGRTRPIRFPRSSSPPTWPPSPCSGSRAPGGRPGAGTSGCPGSSGPPRTTPSAST